nr:hypothetical protein [Candidatus Sigynarchaeota archaeon]
MNDLTTHVSGANPGTPNGSGANPVPRIKYASFILVLISAIILLVETLILLFSGIFQHVITNLVTSILSTVYLFYSAAALYRKERLKGLLAAFIFAGILGINAWQYMLVITSGSGSGIGTVTLEYLATFCYITISVMCVGICGGFMAIVEMKQLETPQGWNSLSKRDKGFIITLIICTPIMSALLLSSDLTKYVGSLPAFQVALILSAVMASFAFAKSSPGGGGGWGGGGGLSISSSGVEAIAIVIAIAIGAPLVIIGIAISVAQQAGQIISNIPGFEPVFFLVLLATLSVVVIARYRSRLRHV